MVHKIDEGIQYVNGIPDPTPSNLHCKKELTTSSCTSKPF